MSSHCRPEVQQSSNQFQFQLALGGGWGWCWGCTSCDGFSFGIVLFLRRLSNGQRGRRWAMRRLSDKQNRELTRESPTPAAVEAEEATRAGAAVAFGVLIRVHTQADACTDMHAHAHAHTHTHTERIHRTCAAARY